MLALRCALLLVVLSMPLGAGAQPCTAPAVPSNPAPAIGAADVSTAAWLNWDPGCRLGIVNGGFESGSFFGWTTVTGPGLEFSGWVVTQFPGPIVGRPGSPREGAWFAQNAFDGEAGLFYDLYQEIAIPAEATEVLFEWSERVAWDLESLCEGCTEPRLYEVQVQPAGGGTPLDVLFAMSLEPNTTGDAGYVNHSVDISAYAGQTIRLNFHQEINETFTGPAQINIDAIGIVCDGNAAKLLDTPRAMSPATSFDLDAYAAFRQRAMSLQSDRSSIAVDDHTTKGGECPPIYDVFLGTSRETMELVCTTGERTCDPGPLQPNTEYFWQVIADVCCDATAGPIWTFTTGAGPCRDGDVDLSCSASPSDALAAFDHFLRAPALPLPQQYHADVVDPQDPPNVTPYDALCIFNLFLKQPSCVAEFPQACSCQEAR